jgi:hypothetical protein
VKFSLSKYKKEIDQEFKDLYSFVQFMSISPTSTLESFSFTRIF